MYCLYTPRAANPIHRNSDLAHPDERKQSPHTHIMRLVLFCTLAVLFLLSCSKGAMAAAPPTAADIKKMKIKDLKAFLEDRGQACKGCQEKSDFVDLAVKHINTPVVAGASGSSTGSSGSSSSGPAAKRAIPAGALWEVWSGHAKDMCVGATAKDSSIADAETICASVATAVEGVFMRQGKKTAAQLKKKLDVLLKTTYGDIYFQAGKRHLARIVNYCLKPANKATCTSPTKLQTLLEKDNSIKGVQLVIYLTNIGIENTNPMYETLKQEKSVPHEEL